MSTQTTHGAEVLLGHAVDASAERRPGIPMEWDPPHPVGGAHWTEPARQLDPGYVLKRKGLDQLTPVFGTTLPPRGLSGALRRAAYEIADHKPAHWLLLMLADRVDVIEAHPLRMLRLVLPVVAGAFALRALRRRR